MSSTETSPTREPLDFFALSPEEVREQIQSLGMPAYRADQVLAWVYKRYEADFSRMTDLSAKDRETLSPRFAFHLPEVVRASRSTDGMTTKLLLELEDDECIEGVVMHHPKRRPTLCVSTQVGCAQACLFCATGTMGLKRDMTAGEIVAQIWLLRRYLAQQEKDELVPSLVFMGMGEPLDNEANFHRALLVLNGQAGFGLGSRKITLSTVGSPERIRRLADLKLQIGLAVSLHAASDELRGKLVRGQKETRISELLEAARYYFDRTGREVTFEYVLIDQVNDSEEQATRLARLLAGFPGKVNLIPLNPVSHNRMQTPSTSAIARFQEILERAGVKVTVRHSQGRDIDAACGQLVVRHQADRPAGTSSGTSLESGTARRKTGSSSRRPPGGQVPTQS